MNTPAHLVLGMAALARPNSPRVNTAAFAGSLLPDLSLYLMGFWALFIQNIPPGIVFGQLYYSEAWQTVFAIDNSFFVWTAFVLAGYWFRKDWLFVFGLAGLLHILFDFPLHHDDGRPHFFPVSDWVFSSPISYWDPRHYGNIVGAIEAVLSLFLAVWMCLKFRSLLARSMIVVLLAAELVPTLGSILFSPPGT